MEILLSHVVQLCTLSQTNITNVLKKHIERSCQNIKGKDTREFLYDERIKGYAASYPITANRVQLCLKIFYFLLKFKNYMIICISLCTGLNNETHVKMQVSSFKFQVLLCILYKCFQMSTSTETLYDIL